MTAEIVQFPVVERANESWRMPIEYNESATILILPVVRVERPEPIVSPETEARVQAMFRRLGMPTPYW